MQRLSKRSALLLGTILCLSISTTALAVLYVTRTVDFTASIVVHGDIKIINADTLEELTSFDFEDFDAFIEAQNKRVNITIENVGNIPLNVTWELVTSGWVWSETQNDYAMSPWQLRVVHETTRWKSVDSTTPELIELGVGQSTDDLFTDVFIELRCAQGNYSPDTITFQIAFYGSDDS